MKNFSYVIDLFERGEFRAHVEDSTGKEVFIVSNENLETVLDEDLNEVEQLVSGEIWLVESGYMRHCEDTKGLESYLKEMGVMPENGRLLAA